MRRRAADVSMPARGGSAGDSLWSARHKHGVDDACGHRADLARLRARAHRLCAGPPVCFVLVGQPAAAAGDGGRVRVGAAGEPLVALQIAGGVVVLAGIYLARRGS